ncbi:MAG: hypothetical protein WCT04_25775 [Planctomycetota bacterium]
MATRKQRRRSMCDRPQAYEHRAEIALYALNHTLQSANYLTFFLTEQLGTDWQKLDHLLAAARSELKQADIWLAKQKQKSRKR